MLAGLEQRGILREHRGKVLRVFNRTRHLEADPEPERELRARLRAAVREPDREVDRRTAALGSLVLTTELVSEVFPDEREREGARRRLEVLSRADLLGGSLGAANDALVAAVMAAVAAGLAASVASMAASVVIVP